MIEISLAQLYQEHSGKVSDKWAIYLSSYERLFLEYRHKPLSLLEIGVQNGGSLEIWSEYFKSASKFIGCDINPDCARLQYDDERMSVVVGDANSDKVQAQILSIESDFDLIIDDGSHQSGDIIKLFARYFPRLKNGGMFVVEDLHCSYWESYDGGIAYPLSSMAFFKRLADVINHESWGINADRTLYLESYFSAYDDSIDEESLSQIHSVEFINSICIIRKKIKEENVLGTRIVAGEIDEVMSVVVPDNSLIEVPDQSNNEWSDVKWILGGGVLELKEAVQVQNDEIAALKAALSESMSELERLGRYASRLEVEVCGIKSSLSWKTTFPLRYIGNVLRKFFR